VVLFWAIVRVIFGIAQMAGAIVLAVCLYRYGMGRETMIALYFTLAATVVSILLFRVLNVHGRGRR
jgi:hypothetical protein